MEWELVEWLMNGFGGWWGREDEWVVVIRLEEGLDGREKWDNVGIVWFEFGGWVGVLEFN